MSDRNGERDMAGVGATTTTLELRLDVAPANDVDPARIPDRVPSLPRPRDVGPFGLARTYWVLWSGMLLNRLGGMVFFFLSIYLTRERGLTPELAGLVISLNA